MSIGSRGHLLDKLLGAKSPFIPGLQLFTRRSLCMLVLATTTRVQGISTRIVGLPSDQIRELTCLVVSGGKPHKTLFVQLMSEDNGLVPVR